MKDIFEEKNKCKECGMPCIRPLEKRLKLCEECMEEKNKSLVSNER